MSKFALETPCRPNGLSFNSCFVLDDDWVQKLLAENEYDDALDDEATRCV
jgi:hypothetical protein